MISLHSINSRLISLPPTSCYQNEKSQCFKHNPNSAGGISVFFLLTPHSPFFLLCLKTEDQRHHFRCSHKKWCFPHSEPNYLLEPGRKVCGSALNCKQHPSLHAGTWELWIINTERGRNYCWFGFHSLCSGRWPVNIKESESLDNSILGADWSDKKANKKYPQTLY